MPRAAVGRADAGRSYVMFGKAGAFAVSLDLAASWPATAEGFVLQGELAGDRLGWSVVFVPGTSTATGSTT